MSISFSFLPSLAERTQKGEAADDDDNDDDDDVDDKFVYEFLYENIDPSSSSVCTFV